MSKKKVKQQAVPESYVLSSMGTPAIVTMRTQNTNAKIKRTKNPIAKMLRYFKPQTYRNKKAYTRKGRTASREAKLDRRGDW